MENFEKLVQRCVDNDENHTIFNASLSHAAILFENLLDVADKKKEDVRIFSGCFEKEFYESLKGKVVKLLNSGVKVHLVSDCEKKDLEENEFIKTVSDHKNGTIKNLSEQKGIPHFILVGDSRYRVELDDSLKTARANFNDSSTGNMLLGLYNKLR